MIERILFRSVWLAILLIVVMLLLLAEAKDAADAQSPVKRIHVTAERFSFTPSRIKIKRGSRLELVLHSEDTVHGFRIAKLGIDQLIPPRGELTVVIEAKDKGQYTFECSRLCGAGHNMMRGVLIVE